MNGKYFPFFKSGVCSLSQQFNRGSCSVAPADRTSTFMLKVLFFPLGMWSFQTLGTDSFPKHATFMLPDFS